MRCHLAFSLSFLVITLCYGLERDDIVGTYELAAGVSNPWHSVIITKHPSKKGVYTWTNDAGVSWTLKYRRNKKGKAKYKVGKDCPYYASGHTFATLYEDDEGVAILGPWKAPYRKQSDNVVDNPCATACSLNSVYGSEEENSYIIMGIFAIWWDKKFDHREIAEQLGEKLNSVRDDCIGNLKLSDPPNVGKGFYYNVYIHHNSDSREQDNYPNGWNQGQGTDSNRNPFLTFPYGLVPQSPSIYHEGFHVFQYSQNSPGFAYNGDSMWYTESSANWYASTRQMDSNTFSTGGAIVGNPQLALWHGFLNEAEVDPASYEGRPGWMYGVRQYAMHTYLYFMTEVCGLKKSLLTSGFYERTKLLPQEYFYVHGGSEMTRTCFANWAAQNTAKMAYLTRAQYKRGILEITLAGTYDPEFYVPYAWEMADTDLSKDQVATPEERYRPRGWGYNVIRVNNTMPATYSFDFKGAKTGSEGAASFFDTRIVVQSSDKDPVYKNLAMANDGLSGQGSITVDANDYEVALIVAAVPETFTGNQNYDYSVKINRQEV